MGIFVGTAHAANELSLPLRTHQAPKIDFICENFSFVAVNLLGIKICDRHCGDGGGSIFHKSFNDRQHIFIFLFYLYSQDRP